MESNILQRHKEERKTLQAKIMNLKHGVSKGDKKKKKEIMELVAKLEAELDQKQEQELQEQPVDELINNVGEKVGTLSTSEDPESETKGPAVKVSKAQKRRDKKAEKERERDKQIAEQEEANLLGARNVEAEKIKSTLKARGLAIYEIPSNGDCLYAAIGHQLIVQEKPSSTAILRSQTASYVRDHKDDFLPFLSDKDSEIFSQEKFESYCNNIENTNAWGGQLELRAMSQVLQQPIEVIQSEGPAIIIGEEFEKPSLILTYHRHAYGLGEHYNSVILAVESPDDDFT